MPNHYLNQCWNIVNSTLGNKLKWNLNRNLYIFIKENALENVVCEMSSILSRPQCVNASDLFSSYLCDRLQRVKVHNCRGEWAVIRNGIPQGSILGPLLFNVLVNDMFHFMEKCDLYNYGDDNSLSVASYHMHDVLSYLSRDCKNAVKWFRDNGMQVQVYDHIPQRGWCQ